MIAPVATLAVDSTSPFAASRDVPEDGLARLRRQILAWSRSCGTEADLYSLDSYHNPNARIIEPAATPMYCWPSTVYVIGPAFHC